MHDGVVLVINVVCSVCILKTMQPLPMEITTRNLRNDIHDSGFAKRYSYMLLLITRCIIYTEPIHEYYMSLMQNVWHVMLNKVLITFIIIITGQM